jgi:hypothetical protein
VGHAGRPRIVGGEKYDIFLMGVPADEYLSAYVNGLLKQLSG